MGSAVLFWAVLRGSAAAADFGDSVRLSQQLDPALGICQESDKFFGFDSDCIWPGAWSTLKLT